MGMTEITMRVVVNFFQSRTLYCKKLFLMMFRVICDTYKFLFTCEYNLLKIFLSLLIQIQYNYKYKYMLEQL